MTFLSFFVARNAMIVAALCQRFLSKCSGCLFVADEGSLVFYYRIHKEGYSMYVSSSPITGYSGVLRDDWRRGLLHRRSETVATHGAGDQIVAVKGHARQHDVAGGPTPRLVQPHRDVVL